MKILIAYAGYKDNVINDLMSAGLPEKAEVLVLSIIGWQAFFGPTGDANSMGKVLFFDKDTITLENANSAAASVCQELQDRFPLWQIVPQVHFGSPPTEVMDTVNAWEPDIIFVGSHSESMEPQTTGTLEHFLFGGVSEQLIAKAECSIHIVRGEKQATHNPVKLLIGMDDSLEAPLALEVVTGRNWPADSQIKIITCIDKLASNELSSYPSPNNGKEILAQNEKLQLVAKPLKLANGVSPVYLIKPGNPTDVFLQEANEWGATCIFIGDKKSDKIKDFLFGTIATELVTQASCSVEVVRNKSH